MRARASPERRCCPRSAPVPTWRERQGGSGLSSRADEHTSYAASVAASYELDFWGRNRSALNAAQSLALATRYDRETIAITVLADVATTYFAILEFRDRLAIANENLANAESVLAIVEARVRNGAASALELAQQRTVVANQRAALPALEQQLRQTENALAILLGVTPDALTVTSGSLGDIALPAVAPGLPSELLSRRPDIGNAEAQLVAANADIGVARAALFPSIQLTAQTGFESLALSSLFNSAGFFYTLVASVTQPIFEGGRLAGQVDLTEARYEELVQVYRSTVINAFRDTEDALVAIRQLAEQQTLQQEAVDAAQAAFELADTRYRGGAGTLLQRPRRPAHPVPGARPGRADPLGPAAGDRVAVPGAGRRMADLDQPVPFSNGWATFRTVTRRRAPSRPSNSIDSPSAMPIRAAPSGVRTDSASSLRSRSVGYTSTTERVRPLSSSRNRTRACMVTVRARFGAVEHLGARQFLQQEVRGLRQLAAAQRAEQLVEAREIALVESDFRQL